MEDEKNTQCHQGGEAQENADQVEVKDRGLFDSLLGKKEEEEKQQEEVLVTGMEKVTVAEPEKAEGKKEKHEAGEKKDSLLAKLHRSSSSSSSSSDEEEEVIDENGEVVKRKKKKGLKEKIKEKLPGHKDQEDEHKTAVPAPATVVVEKIEGDVKTEAPPAPEEEKKGLLDKIKEKLPGGHKKPEDAAVAPAAPAPATEEVSSPDGKERKGILGKIMEKLPGYHKGAGEEEKGAAAAGEHKTSG